jgi:hypothetical protein
MTTRRANRSGEEELREKGGKKTKYECDKGRKLRNCLDVNEGESGSGMSVGRTNKRGGKELRKKGGKETNVRM